ncbi:MAG: hypothetical protein OEZ59_04005 [Deltaproteobacteria bacterium]|nr:hypothetical protein [Deltaproteobacteria bacterium]
MSNTKTITVEVDGYQDPFLFEVTREDYQRMKKEEMKSTGMGSHNLVAKCCKKPEKIASLLDDDWSLEDLLAGKIMEELGLAREARVKKS